MALSLVPLVQPSTGDAAATAAAGEGTPAPFFPEDHRKLEATVPFATLEAFLASVDGRGVAVSVEGKSAGGRPLYLVHLSSPQGAGGPGAFTLLLYAQQHGDEVSGKDALLYLVRDVVKGAFRVPPGVDLWVIPSVNPDGAVAGKRRNGAGADLNRDHVVLEQPETQALHRVVRRLRPHLAVDSHEFARAPEGWKAKGWSKWPVITMDGLNNPLFDRTLVALASRRVEEAAAWEAEAGYPFLRYWVGGAPPDEEQRHSAPDVDGGLNAVGMYGALSFIIEASAPGDEKAPAGDLGRRVDAYLVLFRHLVAGNGRRAEERAAVELARSRPLPPFLPADALWANPEGKVTEFPVVETATGRVRKVPTANMMTDLVVKRSVPTPLGYAVTPGAAPEFGALLSRHGIPFETLASARSVKAETCTLLRVEEEFDDVYSRYGGRQIVRRAAAAEMELPAGSLWVPLAGESALRAALVLEPAGMYGLFAYPRFRALAGSGGSLPLLRVVGGTGSSKEGKP